MAINICKGSIYISTAVKRKPEFEKKEKKTQKLHIHHPCFDPSFSYLKHCLDKFH